MNVFGAARDLKLAGFLELLQRTQAIGDGLAFFRAQDLLLGEHLRVGDASLQIRGA